jgi:signal recognition particle GTPase
MAKKSTKSSASRQVDLNVKEAKEFLKHIIDNNRYLQKTNKPPVAVEVVGDSGIGKTSTIVQLAKELDLNFVKLNLAQIEELGDLVGFPIRQFK